MKNLTVRDGNHTQGGAIRVQHGATLTVSRSKFFSNTATWGGAIHIWNNAIISDSSFDGNSASYGCAVLADGAFLVTRSSFINNSADSGGAIFRAGVEKAKVHLYNSIIAGSTSGSDCYGGLTSNEGNLIQDGACSPSLSGDPQLGSQAGSPAYLPLEAGRPAISAGVVALCMEVDQRGVAPPEYSCEIGAYEMGAIVTAATSTPTATATSTPTATPTETPTNTATPTPTLACPGGAEEAPGKPTGQIGSFGSAGITVSWTAPEGGA